MQPDTPPEQTDTQARERAKKLGQLYPQPTEYSRTFTHTPQVSLPTEAAEQNGSDLAKLSLIGAMTSLPFIAFEVGRSTLAQTTTVTEASQLGMLSLLYLLFITGITLLTYKLFIKQIHVTVISPRFVYWATLLFSIPTTLLLKDVILNDLSLIPAVVMYYAAIIATFAAAVILFTRLRQKVLITLLLTPYILGAIRAVFKIF